MRSAPKVSTRSGIIFSSIILFKNGLGNAGQSEWQVKVEKTERMCGYEDDSRSAVASPSQLFLSELYLIDMLTKLLSGFVFPFSIRLKGPASQRKNAGTEIKLKQIRVENFFADYSPETSQLYLTTHSATRTASLLLRWPTPTRW